MKVGSEEAWAESKEIRPEAFVNRMRWPVVVDGRRTWDPAAMRAGGVDYLAVGLGTKRQA